jgi:coproporphyrinogen III oxidase
MLNFRRIFGNVWKVEVVEPALSKMELFFEKGGVNVSAVHGKLGSHYLCKGSRFFAAD